ncbi:MAG: PKD domain-containing protein, partial [Bacteroidia bacterium]
MKNIYIITFVLFLGVFAYKTAHSQQVNIDILSSDTICLGTNDSLRVTASMSGGTGTYTYKWYPFSYWGWPFPNFQGDTFALSIAGQYPGLNTIVSCAFDQNNIPNPLLIDCDTATYYVISLAECPTPILNLSWFSNNPCVSRPVQFSSTHERFTDSLDYHWDFGDGSPLDTTENPTHTYTTAGNYRVRLCVYDRQQNRNVCDSATIHIAGTCTPLSAQISGPDTLCIDSLEAFFTVIVDGLSSNRASYEWGVLPGQRIVSG